MFAPEEGWTITDHSDSFLLEEDYVRILKSLKDQIEKIEQETDYALKKQDLDEYALTLEKIQSLKKQNIPHILFRDNPLQDLRKVGPEKPMGYLSLITIAECHGNITSLTQELTGRGLKTMQFKEGECTTIGGAFYVYHPEALRNHLEKNKEVLKEASWPIEPEAFVKKVATNQAPPKTLLFNIIEDAFADYSNPGRFLEN